MFEIENTKKNQKKNSEKLFSPQPHLLFFVLKY